jgi:hypothetical protein
VSDAIQVYDDLKQIASDLYCLDGDWFNSLFRRRMTIIRLPSGDLVIHNAIRLKEEDYSKIEKLGRVRWIVAPNAFHGSEAHYYKQRYPHADLFVSGPLKKTISKHTEVNGILPNCWPLDLRTHLECMEFSGTRLLNETVFFHRVSRTLILTDLVFNVQQEVRGGEKAFLKWNRIYQRFGPSRIFRYIFVSDRTEAARSLEQLLAWDFERVIMNHGQILEVQGRQRLKNSFAEMGLTC